jgi:hypothetical protein
VVACVVGDGEVETGPLATAWHSNKFLNPAADGAVLPILHLNGYKISNPTVSARLPEDELASLFEGYGYEPYLVAGAQLPQLRSANSMVSVGSVATVPNCHVYGGNSHGPAEHRARVERLDGHIGPAGYVRVQPDRTVPDDPAPVGVRTLVEDARALAVHAAPGVVGQPLEMYGAHCPRRTAVR